MYFFPILWILYQGFFPLIWILYLPRVIGNYFGFILSYWKASTSPSYWSIIFYQDNGALFFLVFHYIGAYSYAIHSPTILVLYNLYLFHYSGIISFHYIGWYLFYYIACRRSLWGKGLFYEGMGKQILQRALLSRKWILQQNDITAFFMIGETTRLMQGMRRFWKC